MASELYNAMGTSANNEQVQQNPREQAMNLLKQRGINVPDNIANNPQAIIQHLMQSGAVPQQRLQMAQQMMQRMFRR
jgi:RIO-like serine/threonine protein kinase